MAMQDTVKDQLDALLDHYDAERHRRHEQAARAKSAHEQFLEQFDQLCEQVIRPTMEAIGGRLKARGHDFRIEWRRESRDAEGRVKPALISMNLYLAGTDRANYTSTSTPGVSFVADRGGTVYSHGSTMTPFSGGMAGARNNWQPDALTREVVETEILEVLQSVLTNQYYRL
jgi:hypothetical protein